MHGIMAGGLTIEVDEEVQLLENAGAATLFSPGVWVQRRSPGRTPVEALRDAEMEDAHRPPATLDMGGAADGGTAELSPAGADAAMPSPPCAPETAHPHQAPPASPQPMGSPGLAGDADLAYLHISDDREREEREYWQQDREHLAALEDAHARLTEQNAAMQEQLQTVMSQVNEVAGENATIKSLLAMLQVRREDFVFNPQQTIQAQQEAIGMRLLRNLDGSPPGAAAAAPPPPEPPRARQPQAMSLQAQLRQGQQAAADGGWQQPWSAAQQQQEQQQEQQQQQGAALAPGSQQDVAAATAAMHIATFDFSSPAPGMLPLDTPSMLRTVSPKIAAFRGTADLPTTGPAGGQQQQRQQGAPHTVVPASPYDFPAESQIAAAALTAKQGDAAAALLTLLDKAIEGRAERQQVQLPAQQQQQQQQQQQMFNL